MTEPTRAGTTMPSHPPTTGLSGRGVRILVIGTARHDGPTLTPVPAAGRSADAVAAALIEMGGAEPGQVRVVVDPPDAATMSDLVAEAAGAAESVLLIYYVGHGLIGPDGQLYLAARATDVLTPGRASRQALPFREVGDALAGSRATTRIVILDCCFSGRAVLPGAAWPAMPGFSPSAASGTYLMASAERLALAPEDQELTTFSGRFVRLLQDGDARTGPAITLDVVYDRLAAAALDAGEAGPRRQSGDASGSLALAVNRAHHPAESEQPIPPSDGECPYLGLAAFGPQDASRYFGREETVAGLLGGVGSAVAAGSPLTLVAASGAGKTSLLNAGMRPALAAGTPALAGSPGWPVLLMAPGEHPVARLVTRLETAAGEAYGIAEEAEGERAASAEPAEVVRLAQSACEARSASRLVLIVDQLEQVFTLCDAAEERTSFLGALRALAERHVVVLALRADFYGVAAERPELTDVLRHHQTLITAMTPGEMRQAIEGPAAAAGLRLDDGLAALVLRDLGEQDRLPLLSHALWATWRHREGNRLTLGGYSRAGGVAAIGATAETAWASLAEPEAAALRRMLPRLVRVGGEGPETIRPVPLDDLLRGLGDPAVAERALERFTSERLVTRDSTSVRLSHEALLRSWPRLREWIDEDRERLRTGQRLTADAQTWDEAGRDPALLYRGARLGVAAEAAAELGPEATAFLDASRSAQRRSERIRRGVISVLATLLVMAVAAAITAVVFQRQATDQRDLALAGLLAAEADQLRDRQPNVAKQLSVLSYRLDPATGTGPVLSSLAGPGVLNAGTVAYDLAQSGDGALLAVSTGTGLVLRDPRSAAVVSVFGGGELNGPVALSADGRLLAVGVGPDSAEGNTGNMRDLPRPRVRLYGLADPAHPVSLAVLETGDPSITSLALGADGKTLAAAGHNGRIRLWDVTRPEQPRDAGTIDAHKGVVDSLAFSPSGLLLASSGLDKKSRLWTVPGLAKRAEVTSPADWVLAPRVFMHRVAFDATGRYLVTVAATESHEYPRIWDVSNPQKTSAITDDKHFPAPLGSTCSTLTSLAYSRDIDDDQRGYVVGGGDGELCVWRRLPDGLWFASRTPTATAQDLGAAVILKSAKPEYPIVATPTDAGVLLWDLYDAFRPGAIGSIPLLQAGLLNGVTFNPQGPKLVADTSSDIGTRVWDITDRRLPTPVHDFPSHGNNMYNVKGEGIDASTAFSPDGTLFAVPRTDGNQALVDIVATRELTAATHTKTVTPLATLTGFTSGAMGVTFGGADGRILAVADVSHRADGSPSSMRLFDLSDPVAPRLLVNLPTLAFHFAFSPVGPFLYSFSDNKILAWDISDPTKPRPLGSRPLAADSLVVDGQLTPDGRYLIAGDSSRYVRIFPIAGDGRLGDPILLGSRAVLENNRLAISPDGKLLALPGEGTDSDPVVDLYDISKPRAARMNASLAVNTDPSALAFSPNGKLLAVRGDDGADFWSTDPAEVIPRVCASAGDQITPAQWQIYVPGLPYKPPC